jgi:serine/threonine protein kinase
MTSATRPIPRYLPPPAAEDAARAEFDSDDATVRLAGGRPLVLGPDGLLDVVREIGGCRLLRKLGAGGMGVVFAAEDLATGEPFAVKVLRPTLLTEEEARARFFREARAMAAIGHQRIVPVVRVGEDRGIPFIVMPLLRGETLDARLRRGPELPLDEVVRIGAEIADGLEAAHRKGLVHRDVKPANVWLEEPYASVRLLDLGLAREIDRETLLTKTGLVMGTPAYMSPEQGRGDPLGPPSDLFGLGCLLYEMTAGERPFMGPTTFSILAQLETHHPPRVTAKRPSVPALLSNLVMELLAKCPDDRPASAAEVAARLRRVPLDEPPRLPVAPFPSVFDDRGAPAPPTDSEVPENAPPFENGRPVLTALFLLGIAWCMWRLFLA